MRQIGSALRAFFFPGPAASRTRRVLPYAVLGIVTLTGLWMGVVGWEYTNSPQFCGTACHTMPPEFTTYLVSPHARVDCVECHIGRDVFSVRVSRKAGDIRHIVSLAFKTYQFPIRAHQLRPARDSCERCHFPEKFSDDSLREIRHYGTDKHNTITTIYLTLKTGGGTKREGLGRGIHWHIENDVSYLATDPDEQDIPYVRVVEDDGSITEYVDIESGLDPAEVDETKLERLDCITCHNRITHLVYMPEDSVDQLMQRGIVSPTIPEIRLKAVEVLRAQYDSKELALNGIAGLAGYYEAYYPAFYAQNQDLVDEAIAALQEYYQQSIFPEQKANWDSHPNNLGHIRSAGCFRCHDGKHLDVEQESIRLECNLCHSIPVVASETDFVASIEISRGPEPQSHLHANWIGLHRDVFDKTCANCHTTGDAGGTSNTSFCSNSACHGSVYEYAGFDAPGLRDIWLAQLPPTPEPAPVQISSLTFVDSIGPLFEARCTDCHGEGGIRGLNLTTYELALAGSVNGPVILPGDPEGSLLVQVQRGEQAHFGQLTEEELAAVVEWIAAGAPES